MEERIGEKEMLAIKGIWLHKGNNVWMMPGKRISKNISFSFIWIWNNGWDLLEKDEQNGN